jgi:hypothetical protein
MGGIEIGQELYALTVHGGIHLQSKRYNVESVHIIEKTVNPANGGEIDVWIGRDWVCMERGYLAKQLYPTFDAIMDAIKTLQAKEKLGL